MVRDLSAPDAAEGMDAFLREADRALAVRSRRRLGHQLRDGGDRRLGRGRDDRAIAALGLGGVQPHQSPLGWLAVGLIFAALGLILDRGVAMRAELDTVI